MSGKSACCDAETHDFDCDDCGASGDDENGDVCNECDGNGYIQGYRECSVCGDCIDENDLVFPDE